MIANILLLFLLFETCLGCSPSHSTNMAACRLVLFILYLFYNCFAHSRKAVVEIYINLAHEFLLVARFVLKNMIRQKIWLKVAIFNFHRFFYLPVHVSPLSQTGSALARADLSPFARRTLGLNRHSHVIFIKINLFA